MHLTLRKFFIIWLNDITGITTLLDNAKRITSLVSIFSYNLKLEYASIYFLIELFNFIWKNNKPFCKLLWTFNHSFIKRWFIIFIVTVISFMQKLLNLDVSIKSPRWQILQILLACNDEPVAEFRIKNLLRLYVIQCAKWVTEVNN